MDDAPGDAVAPSDANSLEGALADHLAAFAASLLKQGRLVDARFVLTEAWQAQAGMLRHAVEAIGATDHMAACHLPSYIAPMKEADALRDALHRGAALNEEYAQLHAETAIHLTLKGWPVQAALMRDGMADHEAKVGAFKRELAGLEAEFESSAGSGVRT